MNPRMPSSEDREAGPEERPRRRAARSSGPGSTRRPSSVSVAAVSARPATVALVPRQPWSARATYASAAKKANVRIPRSRTAAGNPRAARRVPGGVSRRNAGSAERDARRRPAAAREQRGVGQAGDDHAGAGGERSAQTAARRPASPRPRSRRRRPPVAGPTARDRRQRHARGDADERQQPEEDDPPVERVGDGPASAGPMTPGRTQAVDSVANIRGRSASGSARPIET